VAPAGYVALGHLFKHAGDYNPPVAPDLMCVRRDLVTRDMLGARIWDDHGSRANADLTIYRIDAVDDTAVGAGTFFGHPAGTGTAPGPQTVYCLRASGRPAARTVEAATRRLKARLRAMQKAGQSSPVQLPLRL
jgi:hypothetical protein